MFTYNSSSPGPVTVTRPVFTCHLELVLPSSLYGFSVFIEEMSLGGSQGGSCRRDYLQFGRDILFLTTHKSRKYCGEVEPDLFFVSEANLWQDLPEIDRIIPGHKIYLPKTMKSMKHARIAMIARENLNVKMLDQHMDDKTASIWCRIGNSKKSAITIGGIYREFSQLGIDDRNDSQLTKQRRQEWRWRRIVNHWKTAGRNTNCFVIGDLNLDHLKWGSPDNNQETMIDMIKEDI